MSTPGFKVEFYATASGKEPASEFIEELDAKKRAVLVAAIREILSHQGIDVCRSEWGKALGDGLYEFRVRDAEMTLRVYFHAYGQKIILLLCGYDKGRFGQGRREQRAIERARKYLKEWRQS